MKRIPTFVAGMLTAAVIGGLGVGALAASGQLTIAVDPVNIQVNGETFQPKDAKGADVPVFAYNGTTYAPLRALAEAYGLEVGYDAGAKMATVQAAEMNPTAPADYSDWSAEEEAAYQEFKGMWEITNHTNVESDAATFDACYVGSLTAQEFISYIEETGEETVSKMATRFCQESIVSHKQSSIYFGFVFQDGTKRAAIAGRTVRTPGTPPNFGIKFDLASIKLDFKLAQMLPL